MKQGKLRRDLKHIAGLVKSGSRVLELGCGNGELLSYLTQAKEVDGRGIEISQPGVSSCVQNGLSVIQGDAETDLHYYPEDCFEYVISSQVLQVTYNPREVLDHMLRIGTYAIVSIPNFGHWRNRVYLGMKGQMPVTKALSYQWYETPNIHFCTILDFEVLCRHLGAQIERKLFMNEKGRLFMLPKLFSPNVFADKAIYLIRRVKI